MSYDAACEINSDLGIRLFVFDACVTNCIIDGMNVLLIFLHGRCSNMLLG